MHQQSGKLTEIGGFSGPQILMRVAPQILNQIPKITLISDLLSLRLPIGQVTSNIRRRKKKKKLLLQNRIPPFTLLRVGRGINKPTGLTLCDNKHTATFHITARRYASAVLAIVVCPSVTYQYCIKTSKRRITQTTPHDSPRTLLFAHQKSQQRSNGVTPMGVPNVDVVG